MAILSTNANRMELNRLKKKLQTTKKGYNLLKSKVDGLMLEFLKLSKQTLFLKKQITKNINAANFKLNLAKAKTSKQDVLNKLNPMDSKIKIKLSNSSILGVKTLNFEILEKTQLNENLNYSFFSTSVFLNFAVEEYIKITFNLVELAEKEKNILILANEIKKTRKRVNAIEHILIPNLTQTIRFISIKLEENERNSLARLKRVNLS